MPTGVYKRTKKSKRKTGKVSHLRQANHCNLSRETIEWLEGEMLGDGCLQSLSKYSARFRYNSKYWEYIHYIADTLRSFGIKQSGKIRKNWKGKTHKNGEWVDRPITLFPKSYYYASKSYVELKPIYDRWYPNRKKIIPRDLKLTPIFLRQEYLGDGCLCKPKKWNPCIELCTYGFPTEDVEWLVGELNNLGFKSTRQPANNIIRISSYSTFDFLNYIGKCPVNCYNYKWEV